MNVLWLLPALLLAGVAAWLWNQYQQEKRRADDNKAELDTIAKRKQDEAAAWERQRKLIKLEVGDRIVCFGRTCTVIRYDIIAHPVWREPLFRFFLDDGEGGTIWMGVIATGSLEYHSVSWWTHVPYGGAFPTFEKWEDVVIGGHLFTPHERRTSVYYTSREESEKPPGNFVDCWEYFHDNEDCQRCATDGGIDEDELHIDRIHGGEWVVSIGKRLKLTDVTVLEV